MQTTQQQPDQDLLLPVHKLQILPILSEFIKCPKPTSFYSNTDWMFGTLTDGVTGNSKSWSKINFQVSSFKKWREHTEKPTKLKKNDTLLEFDYQLVKSHIQRITENLTDTVLLIIALFKWIKVY